MKGLLVVERQAGSRSNPRDFCGRSPKKCQPACEDPEQGWILLRGGELLEVEAAALRRHLRRCGRCRRSYRLLEGLLAAIRNEPIPEPDDAFWERMREQIMARIRANTLPPRAGAT